MHTQNKEDLKIGVVGGAGHIGLPLSLYLAKVGFRVMVIDKDRAKLDAIRSGCFPFMEQHGPELLLESKAWSISYTSNVADARDCNVIILTIGTPVDEHLNPDLSPIYKTIADLKPALRDGQCLILRSTLFPGTSEQIYNRLRTDGFNVSVSFCPERIAQGKALDELAVIPQLISGTDERALLIARQVFSRITDELIELSPLEAEITKLYCNAWRYLKFAVANQFYTMAVEKGIDFQRIRHAMTYKYDRAADFPSSGFAAGPCLFKDTMQLAAFSRPMFTLGHAAMLVNETLPDFLVVREKQHQPLHGMNVGILGMAFKPNNDDSRESLSYKLRKILYYEGANVYCSDPYIQDSSFVSTDEILERCKLIFLGVPHRVYADITFSDSHRVVDCWGFYR